MMELDTIGPKKKVDNIIGEKERNGMKMRKMKSKK